MIKVGENMENLSLGEIRQNSLSQHQILQEI